MAVTPPVRLLLDQLQTPIGRALLVIDEDGWLRALDWEDHEARMRQLLDRQYGSAVPLIADRAPEQIRGPIAAYFAGDHQQIERVPCRTAGTAFQQAIWEALRQIPAGQTLSYGALAARLASPQSARAVGAANGANPISVVVPCHRLVGADGSLTGYGGGLHRKRWLLTHEGAAFRDTLELAHG